MEKFAVDLDKVLDDFELNEDRAERFAAKNKTQPNVQQPLLGRVSGRVSSKRDYSRPEGSERIRRINLVDADFAPDPNPFPTPKVSNASREDVIDIGSSKNGALLSQMGKYQNSAASWHQHELSSTKSLSVDVVAPAVDEMPHNLSENIGTGATILNPSQIFNNFKGEDYACSTDRIVVKDVTRVDGFVDKTSASTVDSLIEINSLEIDRTKEESTPSDQIFPTNNTVEEEQNERYNKNAVSITLLNEFSSESSLSEPREEAAQAVAGPSSSVDDHIPLESKIQLNNDRPLDLNLKNTNSKSVPLDSSDANCMVRSSEDIPSSKNHDGSRVLVSEPKNVSHVDVLEDCEIKPISFQLEDEISDAEMIRYLEELEEEDSRNRREAVSLVSKTNEPVADSSREDFETTGSLDTSSVQVIRSVEEIKDKECTETRSECDNLVPPCDGDASEEGKGNSADLKGKESVGVGTNLSERCNKSSNDSESEEDRGLDSSLCKVEDVPLVDMDSGLRTRSMEQMPIEEKQPKEDVGIVQEEGRESPGEDRKGVIDSRVESWVVEGNGKLLEGASLNEVTLTASQDLALLPVDIPVNERESIAPMRPDSLCIASVVASAGILSADEDDPIPLPFVIGPPGATPANPRPPSDIASIIVNERAFVQETGEQIETASLPTVHHGETSPQISSTRNKSPGLSELAKIPDGVELSEQLGVPPIEDSLAASSSDVGEDKQKVSEKEEVPESGEDSSPDSGDMKSLPEDVQSCVMALGVQSVGTVADGSSEVPSSAESASGVTSDDAGCSTLALGDVAPFWVPDGDAPSCMLCAAKFTILKRRHHCRACGKVLCAKCCNSKARLAYLDHSEARVCLPCHSIIQEEVGAAGGHSPTSSGRHNPQHGTAEGASSEHSPRRRPAFGRPDPNNPMEYCSTVPPLEQVGERARAPPPSVMVPVGVLKREGSSRTKGEAKQVMFSDGIRPGGELSDLDRSPNALSASSKSQGVSSVQRKIASRLGKRLPGVLPPGFRSEVQMLKQLSVAAALNGTCSSDVSDPMQGPSSGMKSTSFLKMDPASGPQRRNYMCRSMQQQPKAASALELLLYHFEEGADLDRLMETLRDESEPPVAFALSKNFFVLVKVITLDCCVNRVVWSFTTRGMRCVGQDEVIVLLEWLPTDKGPPRDIFCHLGALYDQASKGNTVTELGHSTVQGMFLGSHNHGGFLYIRATFQCLRRLPLPPPPFLFGLLLHRMETPWAKVFPIRVMLRLGAEFRYYPCPLVGIRGREPVYQQIGHTIMNLLSDFRNFAYILPSVRGMVIHMEERQTSILLPKNRLSQVEKALDDSDDHVLALAASFSSTADSHLVCVQGETGDASTGSNHYHTQAINIQNKPRKVTGASFVVFNGALKASAKLTAKSSIVEDGLMVQVLPDMLTTLRNALRNAEDFIIPCGPVTPAIPSTQQQSSGDDGTQAVPSKPIPDEVVIIRWVDDDKNFNIGVKSPIDGMALDGVPSIRVHNGTNYVSETKFIRWTEVFLIQCCESPGGRSDAMDVSRISESIAHAACLALHPFLDLLWSHALTLIAVRATVGPDSEGYEAGCGGSRLPPIYMNGLDNELVRVLHMVETRPQDGNLVLELLFHLMEL